MNPRQTLDDYLHFLECRHQLRDFLGQLDSGRPADLRKIYSLIGFTRGYQPGSAFARLIEPEMERARAYLSTSHSNDFTSGSTGNSIRDSATSSFNYPEDDFPQHLPRIPPPDPSINHQPLSSAQLCSPSPPIYRGHNSHSNPDCKCVSCSRQSSSILPVPQVSDSRTPGANRAGDIIPITINPTSFDIDRFFESQGIIGERPTGELLIYSLLSKINIGIESLPGSGKTALLYASLSALPRGEYVIVQSSTPGSLYANPLLKKASYLVIPELQKIFTPEIEEIIKNLSEGQPSTHTRTSSDRQSVETMRLEKKSIIYTMAITNRHLKKKDEEFLRRFLVFHTDISAGQNRDIISSYAGKDFENRHTPQSPPAQSSQLSSPDGSLSAAQFKTHIAACLRTQSTIINPYLPYVVSTLPLQALAYLRIRSSIKYLDQVIKGATMFYCPYIPLNPCDRHKSKGPTQQFIFSSWMENQRVLGLIDEPFFNHLYGLDVIDRAVLTLASTKSTLTDFQEQFYSLFGSSSTIRACLDHSLSRLPEEGFLINKPQVALARPLPQLSFNIEEAIHHAGTVMTENYPAHHDEWREVQMANWQYISAGDHPAQLENRLSGEQSFFHGPQNDT